MKFNKNIASVIDHISNLLGISNDNPTYTDSFDSLRIDMNDTTTYIYKQLLYNNYYQNYYADISQLKLPYNEVSNLYSIAKHIVALYKHYVYTKHTSILIKYSTYNNDSMLRFSINSGDPNVIINAGVIYSNRTIIRQKLQIDKKVPECHQWYIIK